MEKYSWRNRVAYAEEQVDITLEAIEKSAGKIEDPLLRGTIRARIHWQIRNVISSVERHHGNIR